MCHTNTNGFGTVWSLSFSTIFLAMTANSCNDKYKLKNEINIFLSSFVPFLLARWLNQLTHVQKKKTNTPQITQKIFP